jgi:HEPN domain-containing protein
MRRNPRDEAIRWLTQAEDEYADAVHLMGQERFYLSLFLAQQSAEKALKAFMYMKEQEHVFTHSVGELLKLSLSLDKDFQSVQDAKRLDDYYIPTRYPNGLPGDIPSRYFDDFDEAKQALGWSEKVIRLVKQKIPGDMKT